VFRCSGRGDLRPGSPSIDPRSRRADQQNAERTGPRLRPAADAAAIFGFCRERLASYKVPVRLAFYTEVQLPRTPTGKIHKPSLAEALAGKGSHGARRGQ
jgi:acyl-CoA synthetase (AMP-forming)/AMP-acid ligase II